MRKISIGLLITLFTAGCVTTQQRSVAISPAQSELQSKTDRLANTTLQGALTGAVIGAGVGALVSKNRAKGALVGAAAGGALGTAGGLYIGNKKQEFASKEEAMDAAIKDAEARVADLQSLVASAQTVVLENQARLAELDNLVGDVQARTVGLQALAGDLAIDLKVIDQAIKNAKGNRDLIAENIADLEKEAAQEATLAQLQETLARYNEAVDALSVFRQRTEEQRQAAVEQGSVEASAS